MKFPHQFHMLSHNNHHLMLKTSNTILNKNTSYMHNIIQHALEEWKNQSGKKSSN